MKISIFKNSFAELPEEHITADELAERLKSGHWQKQVLRLRDIKDLRAYKKTKESLHGVTVSGEFNTRDKFLPIGQRLKKHTGLICLDIDRKDNPKMRTKDLIDRECFMQYVSCSGEGIKIIYRCKTTKDVAEHRRIYDAAVLRLEKKGVKLKIDPIVKNIASLQYVSFDPNLFYFPKSKLVIQPLPPVKIKKVKPSEDQQKDIEQLDEYIAALDGKDITGSYEDWLTIGMGLSYSLGESGRSVFHQISKNYSEYSKDECDEKYDALLERDPNSIERPVTLASVFQIINGGIGKVKARLLAKKYNQQHAVGIGEDVEQGDMAGMVRHKLFLFKKIVDKETSQLIDLQPQRLNLNEFETLLRAKGFFRYESMYVQIVDNIVEKVDDHDILRIVTRHIEDDGDYSFTYSKMEFQFSWEEIVHLWRDIRGQGTTFNQLASCLEHWQPNLLRDGMDYSYIPFKNGVVRISAKEKKLIQYKDIGQQIWKEHILPRDFKYTPEVGMFENFFGNVTSKGKTRELQTKDERYKRALWYFGYMLHGFKKKSMARAWMIYDVKAGNNGRTGKSILGEAIGYIRSMVTIDGKRVNLNDKFALQKVTAWTKVIFMDDPKRGMSITPMFNMITGNTETEAKNKDSLTLSLKYVIASNWIMELEGTSEQGRQFITQLEDYYVKYSKEHGDCLQPIVHLHGKEFFTEWDEDDWKKFDSFCIRALQHHLSKEQPKNNIVGNAMQIRFIQQHESELFWAMCKDFIENCIDEKGGSILISQRLMINVVKEHSDVQTPAKCGRVVKEFLQAIGAGGASITSMRVAGLPQMAYRIKCKFNELNFESLEGDVPKRKS